MYSRIITDELAWEFNWLGLKGKKRFANSLVAKATIGMFRKIVLSVYFDL